MNLTLEETYAFLREKCMQESHNSSYLFYFFDILYSNQVFD